MAHVLYEMARVGNTSDNIEIHVYGKEGNIPHFHFYDKKTERKGCIRLDCPEYFHHGSRYKDELLSKEVDNLISFLNSKNKNFLLRNIEITNFDYICILWNDNNPNYPVEIDNMPDYTGLYWR